MINKTSTKPKVAFICQPEYFRFTYDRALNDIAEVKEFKLTYTMTPPEFTELIDYNANYNIFFRGEYVPDEVLVQLTGEKINLSSEPFPRKINNHIEYTYDSLKRYLAFRHIRNKPFDYVFHYDTSSLDFMKRDGILLSGEFVFPVATNVYRPLKLKRDWDIFFIGRSTDHRENYFSPLKHEFNFLHIAHGIWGEDLVELINRSSISLNIHAEDETSWEPRLQMLLACHAFVISEPITPNPYLRPGIDYIEATNTEGIFESVMYYLNHEDEREKIAENGYQRVKQYFTSERAFSNLITGMEENHYPKFDTRPGLLIWNLFDGLWKLWQNIKSISS